MHGSTEHLNKFPWPCLMSMLMVDCPRDGCFPSNAYLLRSFLPSSPRPQLTTSVHLEWTKKNDMRIHIRQCRPTTICRYEANPHLNTGRSPQPATGHVIFLVQSKLSRPYWVCS